MASQTASDKALDRRLSSDSGNVPQEVRPAPTRRSSFLRGVPSSDLEAFAKVISMPVGENVANPSPTWRQRQADGIKTLDAWLRRTLSRSERMVNSARRRGLSLCPGPLTLCYGHAQLDLDVVHRMRVMIIQETNIKVSALRRYQYEAGVSSEVKRWLERMALIGGLWASPERFRDCYGLAFPDCQEAKKLYLGSLRSGARNPCAACNLAAVGARGRALVDIRAGCLARREFSDRKAPRPMKLLDAWISCFGKKEQKSMNRVSKRLGKAISRAIRQVDLYEEASFAGKPVPGVGVFAAAAEDDETAGTMVRSPTFEAPRHSGGWEIDDEEAALRSPADLYPPMSPYEPLETDPVDDLVSGNTEWDGGVVLHANERWAEDMDPFRSDFTHPSAVPTPLIDGPLWTIMPEPETPERSVSPESGLYHGTLRSSMVSKATVWPAMQGSTPQRQNEDEDDADDSWISESVYTLGDSNLTVTHGRTPRTTAYSPLPRLTAMPTMEEAPITPASANYTYTHNASGLPTPPESNEKRPTPPPRSATYGSPAVTPTTPFQHRPEPGHPSMRSPTSRLRRSNTDRLTRDTDLREMFEREERAKRSPYFNPIPPSSSFYSQD